MRHRCENRNCETLSSRLSRFDSPPSGQPCHTSRFSAGASQASLHSMNFYPDEAERQRLFPVCCTKKFFAHAGVTALPACVRDAMCAYLGEASEQPQEFADVLRDIKNTRRLCAEFIGAHADEIALLGPTSL